MMLGKKRKLGRRIEEISKGEKVSFVEKIEDKDILLYLGLTNDANPIFIQHDYASETVLKKPIVPTILLLGTIHSAISKYLPGPGSHVIKEHIDLLKPVYHYETIQFLLEVVEIEVEEGCIQISVTGTNGSKETVLKGIIHACPPQHLKGMDGRALENF